MNKDDFDLLHQLRRDTADNVALNLVKGLYDRQNGFFKKNSKSKENVETFAEEEFIRKKDFNEMRCEMPGMPRSTFLMVFSPDGSKVASTHGNHIIYITDLRNGKNIRTLEGHPRTPWCIAFHPTSDQIVASGCLGGQVRIWDLSGGSEVWTAVNQTVIASLAFHPNDRVLAIATYNGVYFWDWSRPEPFVHAATFNVKEKVRYVAFDALGHKLITGIANSPMTRWERVRAPVPVPRQERCASPYRRRITQRLVNVAAPSQSQAPMAVSEPSTSQGQGDSTSNPERQRRITMCYRTLVKEYEQLVQRYLQLYRPPLMIDRGTDPMEPSSSPNRYSEPSTSTADGGSTPVAGPSGSSNEPGSSGDAVPSTSGTSRFDRRAQSSSDVTEGGSRNGSEESATPGTSATVDSPSKSAHNLLTPSRIFSVIKKPNTLIRGTQTSESKKHKAQDGGEPKEKRFKKNDGSRANKVAPVTARRPETGGPRPTLLVINLPMLRSEQYRNILDSDGNAAGSTSSRLRSAVNEMGGDTSQYNVEKLLSNIRRTAEQEVRNRILPIIRSVPANDRPELIRLFENSRENVRMRFRRMNPCPRKFNRLPVVTTSDSSSSDEQSTSDHVTRRNSEPSSPPRIVSPAAAFVSSTGASSSNPNISATGVHSVRNFNTELEQLVTSLLNEIEVNETQDTPAEANSNADTQPPREGLGNTVYRQPQPLALWNTPPVPIPLSPNPSPVPVDLRLAPETPPPLARSPSPLDRSPPPLVRSPPPNPNSPTDIGNGNLFQEIMQLLRNRQDYHAGDRENRNNGAGRPSASPAGLGPSNVLSNTSTRTTNSAVYTTSSGGNAQLPPRRRFFSHRISAFMPTRVNYNRSPNRVRRTPLQLPRAMRPGTRGLGATSTFGLDELINFSELENSEDDPPPPPPPPDENHPADPTNPESDISSMYSNIVQELESSLENVVRLRISRRPGETSNMLSSFSERLESILNQSSVILRNLHGSMEMITTGTRRFNTAETGADSSAWNYFDPSFYVRDRRAAAAPAAASPPPDAEGDAFAAPLASVAADHTYPRSAAEGGAAQRPAGGPPMVATIHLTILHIQRQARLLRQQVETIEQIDRAMLEVEQLRLVRTIILALERHVRPVRENAQSTRSTNRSSMSSMRQMMAGTRISDSSPYDSPAEAPPRDAGSPGLSNAPPGEAASSSSNSAPVDSQAGGSGGQTPRQRSSHRKTYPPSRMFRSSRQSRRPLLLNFFSRRILSRADRARQSSQARPATRSTPNNQDPSSNRLPPINSASSSLDSNRLVMMTRRLEQMLTEQMRVFTSAERPRTSGANRSTAMLGEHILALRLHGCVLRMNRVIGFPIRDSRTDPTAAVTRDGVARYNARHLVSLVVDCVSRHLEEFATADVPASTRTMTRGALAISLMITELLQMMVIDSIPPPSGIDFNPETGALASRIEMLCGQMLQYSLPRSSTGALQQCTYSQQLTRSLRLMRLTMRHAHRALGQTYYARRNALQPRPSHQRRHLIGSFNRFLRIISCRRQASSNSQNNSPFQDEAAATTDTTSSAPSASYNDWYATITDLVSQIATFNRDDYIDATQPSTSNRDRVATTQNDVSSNNENSDDDDDDEDDNLGYSLNTSSNLYRANNINLAPSNGESSSAAPFSRPWNVPSVHVNDVPVTEQSVSIAQRMMSQRQRIAERVSELRSNPHVGMFRPRFLHPLYASVNPFDADLDDPQREQIYDSDMITTVTPNHRIQAWDVSDWNIPNIGSPTRNIVVSECKIHNDASVDIAKDGTILVTLLPSGGYLNVTNRLGVYSLRWETLGQCLYTTNFEQNAVSVSLSPLGRHLVVGLASRLVPSDRWIMARVFKIEQKDEPGDRLPVVRELEQSRDSRINCIRWLPTSGQGLIYATNTGQLVVLT